MGLINVIKDVADHNERIEKTHGLTSISKSFRGIYHANMCDVRSFHEASKGLDVVISSFGDKRYPYRAMAAVDNVEIAILLDMHDHKTLKELLENE